MLGAARGVVYSRRAEAVTHALASDAVASSFLGTERWTPGSDGDGTNLLFWDV